MMLDGPLVEVENDVPLQDFVQNTQVSRDSIVFAPIEKSVDIKATGETMKNCCSGLLL